jgi:hypothetical protein
MPHKKTARRRSLVPFEFPLIFAVGTEFARDAFDDIRSREPDQQPCSLQMAGIGSGAGWRGIEPAPSDKRPTLCH